MSFPLRLGFIALLVTGASCTCDGPESCSATAHENSDSVNLIQLPLHVQSDHMDDSTDLMERSTAMLRAHVMESLKDVQIGGRSVSINDLEDAFKLARTSAHINETRIIPPFTMLGFTLTVGMPYVKNFSVEDPDIKFDDAKKTAQMTVGFVSGGAFTISVKQPMMPHFKWCCEIDMKKSLDLKAEIGMTYEGEMTVAAQVIEGPTPKLNITKAMIARKPGGCDLYGDGALDFVLNMAEEPICNVLEAGGNTALKTAAFTATTLADQIGKHFGFVLDLIP